MLHSQFPHANWVDNTCFAEKEKVHKSALKKKQESLANNPTLLLHPFAEAGGGWHLGRKHGLP
jgi:hypothetical protein